MIDQINWNKDSKVKYDKMLEKIPLFHRELTKQVVDKQAPINAQNRNAKEVEDQDIIRAFIAEVPKAFYSLMIRLMDEVGFDYKKYEEEK